MVVKQVSLQQELIFGDKHICRPVWLHSVRVRYCKPSIATDHYQRKKLELRALDWISYKREEVVFITKSLMDVIVVVNTLVVKVPMVVVVEAVVKEEVLKMGFAVIGCSDL